MVFLRIGRIPATMLHRPQHTMDVREVYVWHLLTDSLCASPSLGAVQALLAPEEQARLEKASKYTDRLLYVLSRGLMRTVLASYLGCQCNELRFTVNSFGKPILQSDNGVPPLHFNLTHSRGAIAMAVSRDREVGIDVEERERRVEYMALAQRFFAAGEARHLQELREEERREAFFAIWTLKEAFVKGIGQGLTFPLDAFCFDLEMDRLIRFRPLADFVSPDWYFQQFDLGPRHCGAIAVQNPIGREVCIEMREWGSVFLSA
jgi:4'-phosphopantetheinyl transferase